MGPEHKGKINWHHGKPQNGQKPMVDLKNDLQIFWIRGKIIKIPKRFVLFVARNQMRNVRLCMR